VTAFSLAVYMYKETLKLLVIASKQQAGKQAKDYGFKKYTRRIYVMWAANAIKILHFSS